MTNKRTRPVDGAKLNAHLKARKLDKVLVSQEMGYAAGYLNHCIERGTIGRNAAMILEAKYGISPDCYDPETPFELTATPSSVYKMIDYAIDNLLSKLCGAEITIRIDKPKKKGGLPYDIL